MGGGCVRYIRVCVWLATALSLACEVAAARQPPEIQEMAGRIVTKVAMMTVYTAILTCGGTSFLIRQTNREEKNITKTTAHPMQTAFSTLVVTARVGHIPSSCLKMGCSFKRPFVNSFTGHMAQYP